MPDTGPVAAAVVAGNEVGITGARQCAVPLGSAHLCTGLICGNMEMTWRRDRCAFLGVKESPVQIRPSRLAAIFFRIHFYPIRANKRAIRL